MNDITNDKSNQEFLNDPKNNKNQWQTQKKNSRKLSMAYYGISHIVSGETQPSPFYDLKENGEHMYYYKRALATEQCGNFLDFKAYKDGSMTLHNANFCKIRLCPMCAWRRSLKIFGQVSRIMNVAQLDKDLEYIFITLTVKNVYADALPTAINNLFSGFKWLIKEIPEFSSIAEGWFRALEVTHDTEPVITKAMYYNKKLHKKYVKLGLKPGDVNPEYDTYHPHFHMIVAVKKGYFKSRKYISTANLASMWQKCLKADYVPIVHIQKVQPTKAENAEEINYGEAVAEIAKYTTKSDDFLIDDDKELTMASVKTLDKALKSRRLIGFGGLFRKLHKELNLDDAINGDLIHVSPDGEIRDDLEYIIKKYRWNIGYQNYLEWSGGFE